jgi:hypothetical protein
MKRIIGARGLTAVGLSIGAVAVLATPSASLAGSPTNARIAQPAAAERTAAAAATAAFRARPAATPGAVTRTFSFIAKPNSKTSTLLNIDNFLMNARCDSHGLPVVFAFSSASAGDLFGNFVDGAGRTHLIHNTSFSKGNKGVLVSSTSSDFDASGILEFENSNGKVVTVSYGFDNSTTLNKQNVCTVFGSYVAS